MEALSTFKTSKRSPLRNSETQKPSSPQPQTPQAPSPPSPKSLNPNGLSRDFLPFAAAFRFSISSCSGSSASLVLETARFLACRAWAAGLRARAALGTAHGLGWDVRKVAGLGAGDEFLEFVPPTSQEHETAALAEQSAVDSKSRLSSDRKALRKARLQHRSEPSLRLLRKERERQRPPLAVRSSRSSDQGPEACGEHRSHRDPKDLEHRISRSLGCSSLHPYITRVHVQ